MESAEFKIIQKYRNNIAHQNIEDASRLRSITGTLVELIPYMPEKEVLVIKAVNQSLPSIIQIVETANKFLDDMI